MSLALVGVSARRGEFRLNLPYWQCRAGEIQAVLGANGAGKSSLFALLSGELPYTGRVDFHGKPLASWPARDRARHLAVLPQQSQLAFAFTAAEVVALGLTPLSLHWRAARQAVRRVLERTDCASLAHRAYPSLSGGERQRVNLARVLLQLSQAERAPLLLLDEPTSAQDLGQQHAVLALARELAREQDYAVLAILHDLNQALRYADACLILRRGAPLAAGPPGTVLTAKVVEAQWGYRPLVGDIEGRRVLV